MKNIYTDNLTLYRELNLHGTKHALFTNSYFTDQQYARDMCVDFEKMFVIDGEAVGYEFLQKSKQPNIYAWDSVLDSTVGNYGLYLEHWDHQALVSNHFRLIENLTTPLDCCPKYKFDALLGFTKHHTKIHRQFILDKILTSPNADQFLVSSYENNRWIPGTAETENNILDDLALQGHDFVKQGGQNYNTPLITPLGTEYILTQAIPWKIYNDSWFSIIAETFYDKKFVTEKTGKALEGNRVFIFFGAPGMLAELNNLGFKTFNHVIDERYDLEPDNNTRWRMAWNQVELLCHLDPVKVYTECKTILDHNQKHFYETVQAHNWGAVINQIKELI